MKESTNLLILWMKIIIVKICLLRIFCWIHNILLERWKWLIAFVCIFTFRIKLANVLSPQFVEFLRFEMIVVGLKGLTLKDTIAYQILSTVCLWKTWACRASLETKVRGTVTEIWLLDSEGWVGRISRQRKIEEQLDVKGEVACACEQVKWQVFLQD